MSHFRRLSSCLALLLAGTTVASADPLYDWSGVYVGATAGYGLGQYDQIGMGFTGNPGIYGDDLRGVVGGATLGYNYQTDRWVFGLEADLQASGMRGTHETGSPWTCTGDLCRDRIDWFATLRGRAGYTFDGYMPFVTAGLALANVKSRDGDPSASSSVTDLDKNKLGLAIGVGLEKAFTDHLTAKVEALYVNLSKGEIPGSSYTFTADNQFVVARVGLNWKF